MSVHVCRRLDQSDELTDGGGSFGGWRSLGVCHWRHRILVAGESGFRQPLRDRAFEILLDNLSTGNTNRLQG